MNQYNHCDFYGVDFSPLFVCAEIKSLMTMFARKLVKLDLPLRKRLTLAFGEAFITSYIDLIAADKIIFKEVMNSLTLDKNLLNFGKIVGQGVAGTVHLGSYGDQKVAIKRFNQDSLSFNEKEYLSELGIMDILKHKNLVHLVGASTDSDIYLVAPFYDHGSLVDVIFEKKIPITLARRARMALEIARGLKFLHAFNIIHRDVKTANVLVDSNFRVALTDFGVSRLVNPLNMSRGVGTPLYCSPEVLEGTKYSLKADTYSYSIFLFELMYRTIPYQDKNLFKIQNDIIYNDLRPTFPPKESLDYPELEDSPIKEMIIKCWNNLPSLRPSFTEIVDFWKNEIKNIKVEEEKLPSIDN